ncbi:MAG: hypothetical protein FJ267_03340 [Planctomycetes bacterium]|nr:hypothetical protein [Verrucomicrobiota bacterium]MBM4074657.1 hypothetical protein [Planctomycetota bacterium]
MVLNGNNLTVVGGYRFDGGTGVGGAFVSNPLSATDPNSNALFFPGDIFIDLDGTASLPAGGGSSYSSFLNPGYEFVIAFDGYERGVGVSNAQGHIFSNGAGGGYKIFALTGEDSLVSAQAISGSNPFRLQSTAGRTAVQTGIASWGGPVGDAAADAFINAGTPGVPRSLLGGVHYGLTMDITSILAAVTGTKTFGGHLTMGCGNDEIRGWLPNDARVPDSGLGLGLLGLSFLATHAMRRKLAR